MEAFPESREADSLSARDARLTLKPEEAVIPASWLATRQGGLSAVFDVELNAALNVIPAVLAYEVGAVPSGSCSP